MYYNPIQPYILSRRMCPCYQYRLCILTVKVYDCWWQIGSPGGGEPCGIRGRILMPRFCSSIPQHLEPVVWAPRSLVTTDLLRQGQQTPQGGRRIGSWQPVAVLLTEAGLPHCLFPLDPLHLLLLCPNLWVAFGPERHSSPAVEGSRKEWAVYVIKDPYYFVILFVC